jgi:hypothetical protein
MGPLSERPVAPNDPKYSATRKAKAPFYEKACAGGVGLACNSLALDFDSKNSGMADPPKSAKYFERACYDLFTGASCVILGSKYLEGKGVPKNPTKAIALNMRACNIGYSSGCNNLGKWYLEGNPKAKIAKDAKKGIAVLKGACDQGKVGYSCLELAKYFTSKKDPAAAEYKAKGCALEPKSFDCK